MKLHRLPIFQRLRDILSGMPAGSGKQNGGDDLSWNLLLSGINARVLVAWKKTSNNAYRVYFRHSFSGYAKIELMVCHRMPDGSVRKLSKLYGSGYANTLLTDSRNILHPGPDCNISIVSFCIRYSGFGIPHTLEIDTVEGTQKFLKQGKPFHHGPQFSLALRSFPLSTLLAAPITPRPTQGIFSMAFAAC